MKLMTEIEFEVICNICGEDLTAILNYIIGRGCNELFVNPCKNCQDKKEIVK